MFSQLKKPFFLCGMAWMDGNVIKSNECLIIHSFICIHNDMSVFPVFGCIWAAYIWYWSASSVFTFCLNSIFFQIIWKKSFFSAGWTKIIFAFSLKKMTFFRPLICYLKKVICVSDCLFSVIFIFLTPGFSYIIASFIVKIAWWGHIWFKTIKLSQILPKISNILANFVLNFSDIFFRQFFHIADECYWKKLTFFLCFFHWMQGILKGKNLSEIFTFSLKKVIEFRQKVKADEPCQK